MRRTLPLRRTSASPPVRKKTTASTAPASPMRRTTSRLDGMVDTWMSVAAVPRISDEMPISA